jgi:hypothetical protein
MIAGAGEVLVDVADAVRAVVDRAMQRRPGDPRLELAVVERNGRQSLGAAKHRREHGMRTLAGIPVHDSPRHLVQLIENHRTRRSDE